MSTQGLSPSHRQNFSVYHTALIACRMGINVVPIAPNGTKCPRIPWKVYQQRRATLDEMRRWFVGSQDGIACITGSVSGGLEALDFDTHDIYTRWSERMSLDGWGELHTRLTTGYLEATPNGIHLLYRSDRVEGNQKLAQIPGDAPHRFKTVIETRGEGGLVVIAPSSGGVHPSGKPYVLLQGSLATLHTISAAERQTLFTVARHFDTLPPPAPFTSAPTLSS